MIFQSTVGGGKWAWSLWAKFPDKSLPAEWTICACESGYATPDAANAAVEQFRALVGSARIKTKLPKETT